MAAELSLELVELFAELLDFAFELLDSSAELLDFALELLEDMPYSNAPRSGASPANGNPRSSPLSIAWLSFLEPQEVHVGEAAVGLARAQDSRNFREVFAGHGHARVVEAREVVFRQVKF